VAKQDRTHDLAIVAMYDINKRWSFATNFILYTGNAVTYPTGKYMVQGTIQNAYADRNGNRFPTYHRLDFSFNYEGKKTKKWQGSWNIGLYNAYGKQNPYIIEFKEDPKDASKTQTVQTALFRWVPSITYNFKF
jgi:hypothetical protein